MKKKKSSVNRREFFSKSAAGIASLGIMNLTTSKFFSRNQEINRNIIYRTLGKTKIKMPVVNMGVMNSNSKELIKKSYEIGVRHFDTAASYQRGQNEKVVGQAVRELGVRKNVIIATKVYIPHKQRDMSTSEAKEAYLKSANESLERLNTDYIDILYSHNVQNLNWLNNPGILQAFDQLKQEGKVRFIGFSTHTNMTELISNAADTNNYEVILTSYNYAMSQNSEFINILKKAAAQGIGLVAMKTQCSQYWYQQNLPETQQKYYKGGILHTAMLKWALQNDFITTAIPGYTNFKEMEEDFSVATNLNFSPEEKQFLDDRNVKYSLGYCEQCGECIPTCPKRVDIPDLMRTHMYAACYANFYQARDTIVEIPFQKGLSACSTCYGCVAVCKNYIDIKQRLQELMAMYG
ncbi:MAG: aldo/keto reductase [bacterium]